MTENYFIFIETPLVMKTLKIVTMNIRQQPFKSAMKWYPNERVIRLNFIALSTQNILPVLIFICFQPRIFLADRKTGKMIDRVYETPLFLVFHHGNAYEKDGNIVMDLSAYPNAKVSQLIKQSVL